jgi:hypothetical protein
MLMRRICQELCAERIADLTSSLTARTPGLASPAGAVAGCGGGGGGMAVSVTGSVHNGGTPVFLSPPVCGDRRSQYHPALRGVAATGIPSS